MQKPIYHYNIRTRLPQYFMYRAYSICYASCDPESYYKHQNDYYFKRAKSGAKSIVDSKSPYRFSHISKFTGSSMYKRLEAYRAIDRENLKIFSSMRQTFDYKSPYSKENCKSFELRKRVTTRDLDERERVLVNYVYVRKIAKSMEMPTSQQMAIYELQTGERYNNEMAVNYVQRPAGIKKKLLINPNIRSVYLQAYQERDFERYYTYALDKCHKTPVIPELVAIKKTRQRLSTSGRYESANRVGSICASQSGTSEGFDIHAPQYQFSAPQYNDYQALQATVPPDGNEVAFNEPETYDEPFCGENDGNYGHDQNNGLKEYIAADIAYQSSDRTPEQAEAPREEKPLATLKDAVENDMFDD